MQRSRVWEIIRDTSICMFVTTSGKGLRARPLDARPDSAEEVIYFLTDIRGSKDDEIAADSKVCLVFTDEKAKAYLSITGTASVMKSAALAKKFWKKADEVWWPDRERDPNLRVIRVEPAYAELWDGPADPKVASREFALARATGKKPNLGENRKVVVPLRAGPK
jgi:general stress protein 26